MSHIEELAKEIEQKMFELGDAMKEQGAHISVLSMSVALGIRKSAVYAGNNMYEKSPFTDRSDNGKYGTLLQDIKAACAKSNDGEKVFTDEEGKKYKVVPLQD